MGEMGMEIHSAADSDRIYPTLANIVHGFVRILVRAYVKMKTATFTGSRLSCTLTLDLGQTVC